MAAPATTAVTSSADTLLIDLRDLVEHAFGDIASACSSSDAQSSAVPLHTLARCDLGDEWSRFRARVSALRQIAHRAIQRRHPLLNRENREDAVATAAAAAVASKLATVSRVHARASASMRSLHAALRRSANLIDAQIGNPVAILIGGLRDLAARQRLAIDEARETDAADAGGREERVTLTLYPSGDNNVFAMVLAIDAHRLVADAHVDFMHADAMLSDAAIDAEIGADVSRILSIASATPSAPELRAAFDALEAKIRSVRQLECLLTEFPNGTGDGELALHTVDARIADMFHAAAAASDNAHSDAGSDAEMANASGAKVSACADGNGSSAGAAAEFDVRPLRAATRRCFQGPQLDLFTRPRLPFVEAGPRSTADRGVTRLTYVGLERELPPPAIASSSSAHRTNSNADAMDCAAPTSLPSASSSSFARPPAFDILLRVDPPLALPSRVLSALGLLPSPRAAVPPPAAVSSARAAGGKTDALDAEFALGAGALSSLVAPSQSDRPSFQSLLWHEARAAVAHTNAAHVDSVVHSFRSAFVSAGHQAHFAAADGNSSAAPVSALLPPNVAISNPTSHSVHRSGISGGGAARRSLRNLMRVGRHSFLFEAIALDAALSLSASLSSSSSSSSSSSASTLAAAAATPAFSDAAADGVSVSLLRFPMQRIESVPAMLPVLQHCALWSHMFQSCFHPIEIEVDAPSTLTSPSSNHMRTARIDAAAGHDEDDALSVDVGGACPRHLTLHVAGWATVHIDVGAESVPAAGAADSASHANDATVRIEHVTSTSISGLAADAASGRNRGNACSDAFATRALRRAQFSLPLLLHYLLRAEA